MSDDPPKLDYASPADADPNRAHWSTVALGTILAILVTAGLGAIVLWAFLLA